MRNLAAIKVKANAKYTCQICGSTELIQAHHEIPGDDNSLIPLCADCHSKKHPNLPRALFFNKRCQPYWFNKSASSLALKWGISSRTIIRAAKRLGIHPGELNSSDEERIKNNIPILSPSCMGKLNTSERQQQARLNGLKQYWFIKRVEVYKSRS